MVSRCAYSQCLLLAVLLVAFSGAALAQGTGVSIKASAEGVTLCKGGQVPVSFEVENLEQTEAVVELAAEGTAKPWVSFLPARFYASAGGRETVKAVIEPEHNAHAGKAVVKVTASSGSGKASTLIEVALRDCSEASLFVDPAVRECPGFGRKFSVEVQNTGALDGVFSINTNTDLLKPEKESVFVPAGEKRQAFLVVLGGEKTKGAFDVFLGLNSPDSNDVNSARTTLELVPCHDFQASLDKQKVIACPGEKAELVATIENTGLLDNVVHVSSAGAQVTQMALAPGEAKESRITISERFDPKTFTHPVLVSSSRGGKDGQKAELSADVEVQKCFSATLSPPSEAISVAGRQASTVVKVKNDGSRDSVFRLSLEGPEWARLETESVSLKPGEEASVSVLLEPPAGISAGEYAFQVSVSSDNMPEKSVEVKAKVTPPPTPSAPGSVEGSLQLGPVDVSTQVGNAANSLTSLAGLAQENAFAGLVLVALIVLFMVAVQSGVRSLAKGKGMRPE